MPYSKHEKCGHMPFTEEWFSSSHSTIKAWLVKCCGDGRPSSRFSHLWRELPQSSVRVTIGFLVTSLSKALFAQLLSLAGQPTLWRVPVVPSFFHLTIIEATVLLGRLEAFEMVCTFALIYGSIQFYRRGLQRVPFDFMAWLFVLTCSVNCGTIYCKHSCVIS